MKHFLNQVGFTLIEALISLVITGILSLVTFPMILRLYDYHHLNQALAVLQADLHYVRDFNMGGSYSNNSMSLIIYAQENRYELRMNSQQKVHTERILPKNVEMPLLYPVTEITFNTQGNLSLGQTLLVRSKYYSRYVVFSIGSGGFDIRARH